jgi:hypothetical protein
MCFLCLRVGVCWITFMLNSMDIVLFECFAIFRFRPCTAPNMPNNMPWRDLDMET